MVAPYTTLTITTKAQKAESVIGDYEEYDIFAKVVQNQSECLVKQYMVPGTSASFDVTNIDTRYPVILQLSVYDDVVNDFPLEVVNLTIDQFFSQPKFLYSGTMYGFDGRIESNTNTLYTRGSLEYRFNLPIIRNVLNL